MPMVKGPPKRSLARANRDREKLSLSRFAKRDVLVLDDFLLAPMKGTKRRDLIEGHEDRYDRRSTAA